MTSIDQAARDRIVGHHHRPLVVEAGAGSGKTTNLVGRVVRLLGDREVDPAGIAIITFTDKAARELVHRLRVEATIDGMDRAYIGTIHGFCQRILRQFPIEVGLPPAFSTADEITSSAAAAERRVDLVNELLDRMGDDPELHEAIDVLAENNKVRSLTDLVAVIDRDWKRFSQADLSAPDRAEVQRRVHAAFAPVRALMELPEVRSNRVDDRLAALLTGPIAGWLDRLDRLDLLRISLQTKPPLGGPGAFNFGANTFWEPLTGAKATEIRGRIKESFAAAAAVATDAALRRILAVLAPLTVSAARRRLAQGELGYDDLLVLTHQLLTEHAGARAELRRSLTHLFVDEFQDTDPLQFRIIELLRAQGEPGEPGEPAGPVLFAVGDPKQAIYAFRSADVELFTRLTERAAAEGELAKLVENHRTRPAVTDWINRVVGSRFTGAGASRQADYEDLVPSRPDEPSDPGPAVTLVGADAAGAPLSHRTALPASLAEVADIVDVIAEARGNWLVGSSDPSQAGRTPLRPAAYGDIAVLVRTRAGLGHLEHALRAAEIPYRIEGGSLVYECREVYELLRVLRAIDDPSSAIKLVTALRTTIFGLSDLELFEYRHGTTDERMRPWALPYRSEFDDGGRPGARAVHEVMVELASLVRIKHVLTPAQLLAKLYDEHVGVAIARFEGEQLQAETWRRVRFVIDEARAWSDATGGTLHEYLTWVDTRIEQTDRSEVAPDEREDSVRILTIHAAKGLQFPITVVSGLGRADGGSAGTVVRWVGTRPEISFGALRTLEARDGEAVDLHHAEEARLLYVAMTRAQDHLVVALHSGAARAGCPALRLAPHLSTDGAVVRPARARSAAAAEPDDLDWLRVASAGDPLPVLGRPDPSARRIWTPSGLAKHLGDRSGPAAVADLDVDLDDAWAEQLDDDPTDPRLVVVDSDEARDPGHRKDPPAGFERERSTGRYGTSIGIAVHEVLQRVDLDDPSDGLDRLVVASCDSADLRGRARDDVARLVRSIVGSAPFAELCRASSRRREMYVGTTIGEGDERIVLWGYVDAVFVDERGELVLLDFKTDAAFTSDDELRERYRDQMGAYVEALERSTGRRVARAALLVGRRDGAPAAVVEIEPSTPSARLLGAAAPVAPAVASIEGSGQLSFVDLLGGDDLLG